MTPFENATELTVELQAGVGGTDSKLFVTDLANAYRRYASSLGFKHEVLSDDENGHVILLIKGKGVYAAFRHESGGHCVQRVPPTEGKGRRQTSMISVAVLPLLPQDSKTLISMSDLEITAQTGHQKAGGQNVNKVASAIRCVYKKDPSIRVFINGRDQSRNREEAIRIVNARWQEKIKNQQRNAYSSARKEAMGTGSRGAKVRTYNFILSRVADHRLGRKTRNIEAVMRGRFNILFESTEEASKDDE